MFPETDLEEQLLRVDVVHEAGAVFIDHGQLLSHGADVEASHRRVLLQDEYREWVVDKYLQDL